MKIIKNLQDLNKYRVLNGYVIKDDVVIVPDMKIYGYLRVTGDLTTVGNLEVDSFLLVGGELKANGYLDVDVLLEVGLSLMSNSYVLCEGPIDVNEILSSNGFIKGSIIRAGWYIFSMGFIEAKEIHTQSGIGANKHINAESIFVTDTEFADNIFAGLNLDNLDIKRQDTVSYVIKKVGNIGYGKDDKQE